jgi:hypothetical protein
VSLPRWTVYPALLVLAVFLFPAFVRRPTDASATLARPASGAKHERVVVLGIDGMDPVLLREAIARHPERMRNFAALIEQGGLHPLGTSIPPQSPVAWSDFTTGLDAGGHGIFDFIHRDPERARRRRRRPRSKARAIFLCGATGSSRSAATASRTAPAARSGRSSPTTACRRTSGACRRTSPSSPRRAGRSPG